MEISCIGADLKQEENAKGVIDPISLLDSRATLATPRGKSLMDQ